MIVCVCHRISHRDIEAALASGQRDLESLARTLGVGTGCGQCQDCARTLIDIDETTRTSEREFSA